MYWRILIKLFSIFNMLGWGSFALFAQDTDSVELKRKKIEVRSYIKDLHSLSFGKSMDSMVTGNLIHNRINVRWNPNSKFKGAIEFRNRLFWGEEVRLTPNFSDNIRNKNEAVNASIIWLEGKSLVIQTNIDRFWLEYQGKSWEARIGRQRINWGICTIWNPNDIFNTYNFLDFDYEERPGRDAVKINYQLSPMSNIQIAAATSDQAGKSVAAIKYFTNRWNYDFQFSTGVYHEIFSVGAGWSGNIKDVGFKGELQYFSPYQDTLSHVNLTMELDYLLGKGWYVNGGFLYNSIGISEPINNLGNLSFQLTPQSLMPTKWNTVFTANKEFTPLLTGSLSSIFSPGTNLVIFLPSVKYNLATNLDFDFIWQSFFAEQNMQFEGVSHRVFLRFKWSF